MQEASKTLATFTEQERKEILGGTGIDVGCGNDIVVPNFIAFDKQQGDANRILTYVKDKYHCVASFHCLEHLINPYKSIQDLWELVEDGGYLVIAVPDQDLYQQGVFPSRFNRDHKWTFTVHKKESWSIRSVNIEDLLKLLSNYQIIKLQVQDKGYNYQLKNIDQTFKLGAMAQILLVLKKVNK